MDKQQLKNMIVEHVKARSCNTSLLKLVLSEFETREFAGDKVTVDQIIRKLIDSNNQCLAIRNDEKLENENFFLKSLLPNYLSVIELRNKLEPLGLDSSGASVGKAIKFLTSNGLSCQKM